MKNRYIAALAALCTLLPAAGQQTRKLTAEKHNEYGLVYSLPVTRLQVRVTAEMTRETPGRYWQYAKKYIGAENVVTAPRAEWTVTGVEVIPFGTADTSTQYLMQLKPGATTYMSVADDGMLLSINAQAEAPETPTNERTEPEKDDFNPDEYLQYVNEDFLSSQSAVKQAQMLAENIMEVRDAKISLTRGTADTMPTDGKQLELMLNSLSHQEESMTSAFIGNTFSTTASTSLTFTPSEEGKYTLLRVSDFDGFTTADDYAGEPLYLEVSDIRQGELPVNEKGEEKLIPRDAVIYNIPGTAHVKLTYRGRTLYEQDIQMAQCGMQFGLSPQLFTDRKAPSYAVFNPVTGAVEKIGLVSDLSNE